MFPKYVPTIASQLSAKHLSWREYAQDMGNDPHRDGTVMTKAGPACGHPQLNGVDLTDTTGPANDSYATRHNPFMYFAAIIDDKSLCDSHVVSFVPLASNLKHVSTTPNYSFVTPNTCYDGHDWPKCQDGTPGPAAEGQHVPAGVDPEDQGLAGLQGQRHDRDRVRRVRLR